MLGLLVPQVLKDQQDLLEVLVPQELVLLELLEYKGLLVRKEPQGLKVQLELVLLVYKVLLA